MEYTDYEWFEVYEGIIDRYFTETALEDTLDDWDEDFAPYLDEDEFGEIPWLS